MVPRTRFEEPTQEPGFLVFSLLKFFYRSNLVIMPENSRFKKNVCSRQRTVAIAAGLFTAFSISGLAIFEGYSQSARLGQYERVKVLLEASTVRVGIESGLNEKMSLERGLVAFVASNPRLDAAQYADYAEALIADDPIIKNLALLEGTTIKFVHPYEPNKAAIGKDLALVPEQADAVLKAMTTRDPIVSGPFELVQGGIGLVSRMGIFPVGPDGPRYWGQASVVVDSEEIFRRAGLASHPDISFTLRSRNPAEENTLIFGEQSILDGNPITLEINLPGVSWVLDAVPKDGWKLFRWLSFLVSSIGSVIGSVAGLAVYSLILTRAALREMAYHDHLTGLPNRSLFWDRLGVAIQSAERDHRKISICMVDLNGFKAINDNFGHAAGDRLLTSVASRMLAALRKSDTVARIGGDEFAVIALVDSESGVEEVAARLVSCFKEPFDLGVTNQLSSASIGSALFPEDGNNVEALLAAADHRMYGQKRSVRSR